MMLSQLILQVPRDGPFEIRGYGKAKAKTVFKNTVRPGLYCLLFLSGSRSNLIEIISCVFISFKPHAA